MKKEESTPWLEQFTVENKVKDVHFLEFKERKKAFYVFS